MGVILTTSRISAASTCPVTRPVSIATVVAAANVAAALHRGSERLGDLRDEIGKLQIYMVFLHQFGPGLDRWGGFSFPFYHVFFSSFFSYTMMRFFGVFFFGFSDGCFHLFVLRDVGSRGEFVE